MTGGRHSYTGGVKRTKMPTSTANMADAVDLEGAAEAMNRINARERRDKREDRVRIKYQEDRAKTTLAGGDALAAWLKKEIE